MTRATRIPEFLKEIDGWRAALSRNLALRNKDLSADDLNFAVQATIVRLLFLRMAEDRRLEPREQLLQLSQQDGVYARFLRGVCRDAGEKYNSGLFHFRRKRGAGDEPDRVTRTLTVDDQVFKPILQSLYSDRDSPFHRGELPVAILGAVYERFLSKPVRLTGGRRAKVEEKPAVRKAGGVYYTPAYIVDYLVQETVGRRIEGKSPAQLAGGKDRLPFRVLDMACGGGSFLLGAYRRLLDYCLKWYVEHDPEKHGKAVCRDIRDAPWRLTIGEKKRILTTHIFGVDVDARAAEVTRLSLLLQGLEGETGRGVGRHGVSRQAPLLHGRALPDLAGNIKCGNALIGPDYFTGERTGDPGEIKRVNPLDWERSFPAATQGGGFDCIVGNPPWGGDIDRHLAYFHRTYPATTREHTDSFKLFIERGMRLLSPAGLCAMIVPNAILRQRRLKDVRALLLENRILFLVDLGADVFPGVVAPSSVFVVERKEPSPAHEVVVADLAALPPIRQAERLAAGGPIGRTMKQAAFQRNAGLDFAAGPKAHRVPVVLLGECDELQCKDAGINYQRVGAGMQDKGKSDLAARLLYEGRREKAADMMYWKGADVDRYWMAESTARFCRANYRRFLRAKEVVRLNERVFETAPKILLRQTADRPIAALDRRGVWFGRSLLAIMLKPGSPYKAEYFLGLLNSKYLQWAYNALAHEAGRVFAQVKLAKVKQLPLRTVRFADAASKAAHDRLAALVESMLAFHKELAGTKSAARKTSIRRQIVVTDAEIDRLVYDLYGLTAEEIATVEEPDTAVNGCAARSVRRLLA